MIGQTRNGLGKDHIAIVKTFTISMVYDVADIHTFETTHQYLYIRMINLNFHRDETSMVALFEMQIVPHLKLSCRTMKSKKNRKSLFLVIQLNPLPIETKLDTGLA